MDSWTYLGFVWRFFISPDSLSTDDASFPYRLLALFVFFFFLLTIPSRFHTYSSSSTNNHKINLYNQLEIISEPHHTIAPDLRLISRSEPMNDQPTTPW